jgi:hypothetical protein
MHLSVPADRSLSQPRSLNSALPEREMIDIHTHEAAVLFYGLDEELSLELRESLAVFCDGIDVRPVSGSVDSIRFLNTAPLQIIFCKPDVELVKDIRRKNADTFIVAVSRLPEVMDWLDCIEAGASDYCAAPFEVPHLQWIFESCLRCSMLAA